MGTKTERETSKQTLETEIKTTNRQETKERLDNI